jgi:hypothetical protein
LPATPSSSSGSRSGSPGHNDDWSDRADEATVALAQVALAENTKIVYVYDFGDDWRHDIVVEKILPAETGVAYLAELSAVVAQER